MKYKQSVTVFFLAYTRPWAAWPHTLCFHVTEHTDRTLTPHPLTTSVHSSTWHLNFMFLFFVQKISDTTQGMHCDGFDWPIWKELKGTDAYKYWSSGKLHILQPSAAAQTFTVCRKLWSGLVKDEMRLSWFLSLSISLSLTFTPGESTLQCTFLCPSLSFAVLHKSSLLVKQAMNLDSAQRWNPADERESMHAIHSVPADWMGE